MCICWGKISIYRTKIESICGCLRFLFRCTLIIRNPSTLFWNIDFECISKALIKLLRLLLRLKKNPLITQHSHTVYCVYFSSVSRSYYCHFMFSKNTPHTFSQVVGMGADFRFCVVNPKKIKTKVYFLIMQGHLCIWTGENVAIRTNHPLGPTTRVSLSLFTHPAMFSYFLFYSYLLLFQKQ